MSKWGLQAFLYQMPVQTLLQALLAGMHWGLLAGRCERQRLDAGFAVAFVALEVSATYLVAWLMSEEGGRPPRARAVAARGGAGRGVV